MVHKVVHKESDQVLTINLATSPRFHRVAPSVQKCG